MQKQKRSFSPGSSAPSKMDERVILAYLEALDCPRALSVWLCFKYDHPSLLSLDFQVDHYLDFESFRRAYFATAFLSKYDGLDLGVDRRLCGIEKFAESEVTCYQTNERLRTAWRPEQSGAAHILDMARVKIAELLPPLTSEVLDDIIGLSRFGPGVTTDCKGQWLTPSEKLLKGKVTPGLRGNLDTSLRGSDFPTFASLHKGEVEFGNHVITVPKNAKTDRTIAVEPGINAFFQRGVGVFLQKRLRRWGVDLRDQSVNQDLAREGSISSLLATVDLSAASDSLAIETVRLLLPRDWVVLLETLRSPNYKIGEYWTRYEKHSSMGNGYTFELESLIFFSLLLGIRRLHGKKDDIISVYGDDIICPVAYMSHLISTLDVLGFQVNREKTFCSSPFRESCGAHFYDGKACTPFYFKKSRSVPQVITLANWIYSKDRKVWLTCYRAVPSRWANKGPSNGPGVYFVVDDVDLHGELRVVWRFGRRYLAFRSIVFIPTSTPLDPSNGLGHALFALDQRSPPSGVIDASDRYVREPVLRQARGSGRWVSKRVLTDDLGLYTFGTLSLLEDHSDPRSLMVNGDNP